MDFVKKHENAVIPQRQTDGAAGYDIHALCDVLIPAGTLGIVDTGLGVHFEDGESDLVLLLKERSSLSRKYGLLLMGGVIDSDYEHDIGVYLHNLGPQDYLVRAGDRVCQGILANYYVTGNDVACGYVRGESGSTGR